MQVSHVQDHVTHAVIGATKNVEFGISNSAEFFHILSSTLYKDQILAVVREVLCNAWDAHIDAGIRDVPIEIRLENGKLTVRDKGKGIHDDDIGPVYGTYGNSTKKHDGKQTGGFGLGCKAPFAYVDHFQVVSSHAGTRTIYEMSKSSAEVGGKPGIVAIVKFPTTESGLEVSLAVQPQDMERFATLIRRIIKNGEMNAVVNGIAAKVIPFSEAKEDFLITREQISDVRSQVNIRYGNVIYPVDTHEMYAANYNKIAILLGQLDQNAIVFQAPPHSISVQPSREGLSMQSHTIDTLVKITDNFVKKMDNQFNNAKKYIVESTLRTLWAEKKYPLIFNVSKQIHGIKQSDDKDKEYIVDLTTMAGRHVSRHYPDYKNAERDEINLRLDLMLKDNFGSQPLVKSFKKAWRIAHQDDAVIDGEVMHRWFQERVIKLMLRRIHKAELMPRLYVMAHGAQYNNLSMYKCSDALQHYTVVQAHRSARTYLNYVKNIVVLSHSKNEIHDRAARYPEMKDLGAGAYLVLVVSRQAETTEKARKMLIDAGVVLIDLTKRQDWEPVPEVAQAVVRVTKKKKKGIPCLSASICSTQGGIDLLQCREEDAERIEKPEFVTKLRQKHKDAESEQRERLPGYSEAATKAIVHLFGSKGGVILTDVQATNYKEEGVQLLDDYLSDKVMEEVKCNIRIKNYLEIGLKSLQEKNKYVVDEDLIEMFLGTKIMCQALGLPFDLTDEDRMYLVLWDQVRKNNGRHNYSSKQRPDVVQLEKDIEALPTNQLSIDTVELMKNNDLLSLIDVSKAKRILAMVPGPTTQSKIDKVRDILLLALKA